jgi:hypothetical protein
MSGLLFTTNELKDAVFSLTLVNGCLAKVFQDNLYWKWVFIALHNGMQSFMVASLCPFNDDAAILHPEKWEVWRKDPENNQRPNQRYLLKLKPLYQRIQDPTYMEGIFGARAFKPSGTQDESVERLNNELRNDFIHFLPGTKLRFVDDFLTVVKDVTGIISFLAFDSNTIDWGDRDDLRSTTKSLITIISANVTELEKAYAARAKQKNPPDPELEARAAALLKRFQETPDQ